MKDENLKKESYVSMSLNFKASVSLSNYPQKPTSDDLIDMIFIRKELNHTELYQAIRNGHSICHVFNKQNFMNTNKTLQNFIEAYFIVLDFDGCSLTFDYVLNNAIIKPTIAFETFSNTNEDIRFKMIYVLDEVIRDKNKYKRMTEMVFNIAFNQTDKSELIKSLDPSCYTANQMFHGTGKDKRVELSDTFISIDFINQIFESEDIVFNSYENLLNYLNIPEDFKPTSKKKQTTSNKKKCTNKRKTRIIQYIQHDFSYIPDFGAVENSLFDMSINNDVYFIPSIYNNYHTIQIPDQEQDNVYYFIGNQNIYAVNTYFIGGKQKVGYRKKTLQYAAHVFCNLYPDISENELFVKLRNYVIKFFEQPGDFDNDYIHRLAKSVCNMTNHNDLGKKYFVLNPAYSYLNKSEKMKELQKRRSEMMRLYILNNHDGSLTLKQLAEKLQIHPKTIKKYLDADGVCYLRNNKKEEGFQKFLLIYSDEENQKLAKINLAEKCGVSMTQLRRYLKRMMQS
ncbi:MAG: hypothetical protein VB066_10945 [Paludibacter sp.]|nr:hypothetical protein [Paludibacter sp.]